MENKVFTKLTFLKVKVIKNSFLTITTISIFSFNFKIYSIEILNLNAV